MAVLSPGQLPHEVTFSSLSETASDQGMVMTETEIATVRARIETKNRNRFVEGQGLKYVTDHIVTVRYMSALSGARTATFEGRTFEILSIRTVDEIGRWMVIECEERLNG